MSLTSHYLRRLKRLLGREDLRRHPFKAIYRRIAWRLRWRVSSQLWSARVGGLRLFLPNGGAGALIYLQGASEPQLAEFVKRFLKPGMVFADVGANLGEYTVLAAQILQTSGKVYAFEPRPDTFEVLTSNISVNGFTNISAKPWAVWNKDGFSEFEKTPDPSVSKLRPDDTMLDKHSLVRVRTVTLNDYFADPGIAKPDLIKIDVEGAELQVLEGASSLLTSPQAPTLIVEYGPANAAGFGYKALEILEFLRQMQYTIYEFRQNRLEFLKGMPTLEATEGTCNLIATKTLLPSQA